MNFPNLIDKSNVAWLKRLIFLNGLIVYEFFILIFSKFYKLESSIAVDVIITLHVKDIPNLKQCIFSINKNLMHPKKNIYIITQRSENVIKLIQNLGAIFIDEINFTNISKEKINYYHRGKDRSGWLFQQFLNYAAVMSLGDCEYKFCINSDTILSKKQIFIKKNKIIFNASNDYQKEYFDIAVKLLKLKKVSKFSFTSHHMLYKRSVMNEMLKTIEKNFNLLWHDAILNNVNKNVMSCHSEFETYAQFFYNHHRKIMKIEYWCNKTVFKHTKIDNLFNHFFYKSISFHSWAKNL